ISDEILTAALNNIYRKTVNVKKEIEPELWRETVRVFNLATATGLSDAVDGDTPMPTEGFMQALKNNNDVFAAFRTHRMQNDIAALMTDREGNLKSTQLLCVLIMLPIGNNLRRKKTYCLT
ncbi:MAG: hypothetical protein RR341_08445, partial [Bacteroidales bacterium]